MRLNNGHVYIVAELSANHRQEKSIALESVVAAAECGVDAIKVQTYTPDTLTIDCDNDVFRIKQGTLWDGKTLYSLYKEAYTPWEWLPELKQCAEAHGIDFFSSPFDRTAVDLLSSLNVCAYKIASFEINDLELIGYVCTKKKPVILSTGVATLAEIAAAVDICRFAGVEPILLHCTSSYPSSPTQMNLATIPNMKSTFGTRVGLSDHTIGSAIAIAAVALGASIIEKHFIIDPEVGGPDAAFSMGPKDFRSMVDAIRTVELSIGHVDYNLSEEKRKSRKFMRSLFVVAEMQEGEIFTRENVRSIRPGDGMAPIYIKEVLGRRAKMHIPRGTPLSWDKVS